MFCSEKCQKSYQNYISYFKNPLPEFPNYKEEFFACATFAFFGHLFGSMRMFFLFMKQIDSADSNCSIFDLDLSDPSSLDYKINLLKCFLNNIRQHLPEIRECESLESFYRKFGKHFSKACLRCLLKTDRGYSFSFFASLLNHSCIPNIQCITFDDKFVFYVTRPVKKGEQLLANRRLLISKKLISPCICYACIHNYDLSFSIEIENQNLTAEIDETTSVTEIIRLLQEYNVTDIPDEKDCLTADYWKFFFGYKQLMEKLAHKAFSPFSLDSIKEYCKKD